MVLYLGYKGTLFDVSLCDQAPNLTEISVPGVGGSFQSLYLSISVKPEHLKVLLFSRDLKIKEPKVSRCLSVPGRAFSKSMNSASIL